MMQKRSSRPVGFLSMLPRHGALAGLLTMLLWLPLCFATPALLAADAEGAAEIEEVPALELQLQEVRASLSERRQALAQRNQELVARQAELEREDPIASGLRAKMVEHQREVEALRRSLKVRLEAIEEIQALEAERREVIEELQQLAIQERELSEAVREAAETAAHQDGD